MKQEPTIPDLSADDNGESDLLGKNRADLLTALTVNKKDACQQKFEAMFRSQDIFGAHVHFTYKGKDSYQTNIGAFISMFVKAIMICFIVYEFYVIFARKEPQVAIKASLNPYATDPSSTSLLLNPHERGFDIAVTIL